MRKQAFLWILLLLTTALSAQVRRNQTYQNYISQYKDIAIEEMRRHRIPASITLAQGLLESGAGQSELALHGNNHFGIKCHDWTGPTMHKDDDANNECFRVYSNALESFEDHSRFLERPRYASLFQLSATDYKGWARGLKAAGYATNPRYADKLIELIELYDLHQYDLAAGSSMPATPAVPSQGGPVIPQYQRHPIFSYNKNYYLRAHSGDTFKSLADEVGVSARKLAKNNERDRHDRLSEGDIIYLKAKRSKAEKQFKKRPHIVKPGESMYSVSQIYGIKVKSLYKKNGLTPDYQIKVGDRLKVY